MTDDYSEDPQENPNETTHLPVSGEVGNGPVSYHDPLTKDTDDQPVQSDDDLQDTSLSDDNGSDEPNQVDVQDNEGSS